MNFDINTLITDRTAQDVANQTEKGRYTASDLNRVGAAMAYLRDRLTSAGYLIDIVLETAWLDSSTQTDGAMEFYLSCLGALRGALSLPSGTPAVPATMEHLTYVTANNIEKILETVDQMLSNSQAAAWYSGDIYSGEVI